MANRGFQAVNAPLPKPAGDMRINDLLNDDDAPVDVSPQGPPAATGSLKKGPGRGNWRRNKTKQETVPLAVRGTETAHHVPLLPGPVAAAFVHETPYAQLQPATPSSGAFGHHNNGNVQVSPQHGTTLSFQPPNTRDHIPTPSYQAQKRHRGITQHQSAVITHRKQQIDYTLDRRLRKVHSRARDRRESKGTILRAWKRIRLMPTDYDSEEEQIKIRKVRDRGDKDDDWRLHRGKENVDSVEDLEVMRRPRVLLAGMTRITGEAPDVGEEAKTIAQTFRRASRRLERWQESTAPGQAMIRRRQQQMQERMQRRRRGPVARQLSMNHDGMDMADDERPARRSIQRQRSGTGRRSVHMAISGGVEEEQKVNLEPDDEDGGGELDEEDRELLGEVDADESEDEDEDEEMGDD